jgi:hypothetical protein
MAHIPAAKLFSLFVKTLAKPVAKELKSKAIIAYSSHMAWSISSQGHYNRSDSLCWLQGFQHQAT